MKPIKSFPIVKICSSILALAGVVTIIIKLTIVYEDSAHKQEAILSKLNDVDSLVKTVEKKSNQIIGDVLTIRGTQASIKEAQEELMLSQNALRNSYTLYLQRDKSLTKEDFMKYMDGVAFEIKKKSGANLLEIPLLPQHIEIQQN